MFIPPWYQQFIVQTIPKLVIKLPYRKLQYPTYVKDTNPNAHIRVFKKAIKTNGETMEDNIINMFSFTLRDNIFKFGLKILFKTIQTTYLKSWSNHFASNLELYKMMRRSICNCNTYNNKPLNVLIL